MVKELLYCALSNEQFERTESRKWVGLPITRVNAALFTSAEFPGSARAANHFRKPPADQRRISIKVQKELFFSLKTKN